MRCDFHDDHLDESTQCPNDVEPGRSYCLDHLDPSIWDEYDQAAHAPGDKPSDDVAKLTDSSFEPVDLAVVLAGDYTQPEPVVLRRDDRRALFYRGQVNGTHGPDASGKSWLADAAVVDQVRAGHCAVFLDLEDVAPSFVARLRILGLSDNEIVERVTYIRPQAAFTTFNVDRLVEQIEHIDPSIVVIDSLGEAFGLDGINEDRDDEVGPWLRRIPRRIADLGPAVVLIDHTTKSADNPLFASGSKRKRAAIGGASYLVTAVGEWTKEAGGRARVVCAKDRHGNYARNEHVADFVMNTDIVGTRWSLYAPTSDDAADTLPMVLAARAAVEAVKAEGAPMSLRSLIGAMDKLKCRRDVKIGGIDLAVTRKALEESPGPRNARLFTYLADLPEVTNV